MENVQVTLSPSDIARIIASIPVPDSIQILFTAIRAWVQMLIPYDPKEIQSPWLQQMYKPLGERYASGDLHVSPEVVQYLTKIDSNSFIQTVNTSSDEYRKVLLLLLYKQLHAQLTHVKGSRRGLGAGHQPIEAYNSQISLVVTHALNTPIHRSVSWWTELIISWATLSPDVPQRSGETYDSRLLVSRILEWLER
jgi:hypothetical protein